MAGQEGRLTSVLARPGWLLRRVRTADAAAAASIGAAIIHALVAPDHYDEWPGYGWFFVITAVIQASYGVRLLFSRETPGPSFLLFGVGFNLLVAGIYVLTRASGIPVFGPHAGHVEAVDLAGVVSVVFELGTSACLALLLLRDVEGQHFRWSRTRATGLTVVGVAAAVALIWGVAHVQVRFENGTITSTGVASQDPASRALAEVPASELPSYAQLFQLLARSGYGANGTALEAFFAPPVYFTVSGTEAPAGTADRPTFVFVTQELDHEHSGDLLPDLAPTASLKVDGLPAVAPYDSAVLYVADDHRTTQFLFPFPTELDGGDVFSEAHSLSVVIRQGQGAESTFTWELPLASRGTSMTTAPVIDQLPLTELSQHLTRFVEGAAYGGVDDIRVEAVYATPSYFAAALPAATTAAFRPDLYASFLIVERLHSADLPASAPEYVLKVDGTPYQSSLSQVITTSPHHRATLVRFSAEPPTGLRHRLVELEVPGKTPMAWHFPLNISGAQAGVVGVSGVWLLAILGGLIAAMWPCLFQLTVFFVPSLAGVSMHDASNGVSVVQRAAVVKAALFFVLGFTVVYTLAGGLIGYLAGHLSDMSAFYKWQRYLGIAGGIVILVLAVRVAAQVRAPLVCKMPLVSGMGKKKGPASPLQMMVAGVAFATGCMTCFGAAVVIAMVVYVGMAGSAFVGALTLFLFAIGMGIPLVLASTVMARVIPLLNRFEKAVRWMGLASTLVMAGFALLLITGNYMMLTEWIYRVVPGAG